MKWDSKAIKGMHKWLNRVWNLCHEHIDACSISSVDEGSEELYKKLVSVQHTTIKQVQILCSYLLSPNFEGLHCERF